MSRVTQHVDPWLVAHGIIFVINYAILMPVASFLIYYNRDKFYQTHCLMGIIITVLLVAGWASLQGTAADKANGYQYGPMSESAVAKSHSATGILARFMAVFVCIVGVMLGVLRMPKNVRRGVRIAHGVAGVLISLLGPIVVWNGFVRLQPFLPPISFFDSTPIFWYSVVIGLLLFSAWKLVHSLTHKSKSEIIPLITPEEIRAMIQQGKLVLVVNGDVCEIPKEFDHPGGRAVMEHFNGQEVGKVFSGKLSFEAKGRVRHYAHSTAAMEQVRMFKIGIAETKGQQEIEMSPIIEAGKIQGKIVSMEQVNSAQDFPVRLFRIKIGPDAGIGLGCRVFISIPGDTDKVQRPYTVCHAEEEFIEFCIKIYPQGALTRKLDKMKSGQTLNFSDPVSHAPMPSIPKPPKMAVFLAGGTGMAPMIGYLKVCASLSLGGWLLWWVRHEGDLFLVHQLEEWGRKYDVKIQVFFTQSKTEKSVDGLSNSPKTGRITQQAILDVFGGALPVDVGDVAWVFSGPAGFVDATTETLTSIGASSTRIVALD